MKIVSRPIKVMAVFGYEGTPPTPYKFKMVENGEEITVKVDYVLNTETSRIAGINSIIYECQSVIHGTEKRYELKFIPKECKWVLYKI